MLLGGKDTWDNILAYIHEEKPDIMFLQEVHNSKEPNVPSYLSSYEALKKEFSFPYSEYETQFNLINENEYAPSGLAILSKFPLTKKRVLWLHGDAPIEFDIKDREQIPTLPRNLMHCQAEINNKIVNLMTLQGVWAPDEKELETQKEMANKIFEYISDKNEIILGGDFNVNENTESIDLISQKLNNVFKGERVTSFNMTRKTKPGYGVAVVDFIFTSPSIKVVEHYTSDHDVSDHKSQVITVEA